MIVTTWWPPSTTSTRACPSRLPTFARTCERARRERAEDATPVGPDVGIEALDARVVEVPPRAADPPGRSRARRRGRAPVRDPGRAPRARRRRARGRPRSAPSSSATVARTLGKAPSLVEHADGSGRPRARPSSVTRPVAVGAAPHAAHGDAHARSRACPSGRAGGRARCRARVRSTGPHAGRSSSDSTRVSLLPRILRRTLRIGLPRGRSAPQAPRTGGPARRGSASPGPPPCAPPTPVGDRRAVPPPSVARAAPVARPGSSIRPSGRAAALRRVGRGSLGAARHAGHVGMEAGSRPPRRPGLATLDACHPRCRPGRTWRPACTIASRSRSTVEAAHAGPGIGKDGIMRGGRQTYPSGASTAMSSNGGGSGAASPLRCQPASHRATRSDGSSRGTSPPSDRGHGSRR